MISDIVKRLETVSDIEDAILEAKLLVSYVIKKDYRSVLISDEKLNSGQEKQLEELITRRLSGEPIQYILGEWEFMGLPFYVEKGVLIPRQDTETLCEEAIRIIKEKSYLTALDLCCGSGCIGISVSKLTGINMLLGDISELCLEVAERNAKRNQINVQTTRTDLFSNLNGKRFDLILCNPPYLNQNEMETLQKEVRFEPELALYGGVDGFDFYKRISGSYSEHLNENGTMLLEIGYSQWDGIQKLLPTAELIYDLAGNPRVVKIQKHEGSKCLIN